MDVRFSPLLPTTLLVLGLVNGVLGLLLLGSGGTTSPSLFLAPLFVIVGLVQFGRTYFTFDPGRGSITVSALVGPASRHFGGGGARGELAVDGNRIVCIRDGRTKRVPVNKVLARDDQWESVVSQLRAGAPAGS